MQIFIERLVVVSFVVSYMINGVGDVFEFGTYDVDEMGELSSSYR